MLRATGPRVLQTVAFGKWYVTIFNNIWVSFLVAYSKQCLPIVIATAVDDVTVSYLAWISAVP